MSANPPPGNKRLLNCQVPYPLPRVCLLMLERKRSWNLVETLETHREERQMEENSLHNQHNIVNFLLEVILSNTIPNYLWPNSTYTITASQADRHPAQSNSSRCHQVHSRLFSQVVIISLLPPGLMMSLMSMLSRSVASRTVNVASIHSQQ